MTYTLYFPGSSRELTFVHWQEGSVEKEGEERKGANGGNPA